MASGSNSTVLTSTGNNGKTNLLISWNENSTSTANNTSNITVTAKMTYNSCKWDVTNSGTLYAYWHDNHDNTDRWVAELSFNEFGYNTTTREASGTFNATHNDDGKLSGYAFARWTQKSSYGGYAPSSGDCRAPSSGWTALTDIARKATVTSVQNFNDEGNPVLGYENKAGNAVTTLKAGIFNTAGTTAYAAYRDITKTGSSYTFSLTTAERNALRNAIPNATSMKVRFYVQTVIGSNTFTDYKEATLSITNANPTFTNFTYADTNSTITAITGNNRYLVSGKSTLRATISSANKAVANKGASMSTYTFAINGATSSQAYSTSDINKDLGTVTLATNETTNTVKALTVTAVDSRGYNKAVSKDITVLPYKNPVVNASATRLNGFENTTTMSISGTFSILSVNGTSKNTVNTSTGVAYRYKAQSTTTWGSWTNKTATVNTTNGTVTVANFTLDLDNQTSYDFQIRITDKLATTTKSLVVSVGQPSFWIGADGRVCVGGMPSASKKSGEAGLLEVKGRIKLYDGQYVDSTQKGAWWQARDKAVVRNTDTGTDSAYAPIIDGLTRSGDWSVGTLKSDTYNQLYLAYTPNDNHTAGNNNGSSQIAIQPGGRNSFLISQNNNFDKIVQYKACPRSDFTSASTAWASQNVSGWDFTFNTVNNGLYKVTFHTNYAISSAATEYDFSIAVVSGLTSVVQVGDTNTNGNYGQARTGFAIVKATGTTGKVQLTTLCGATSVTNKIYAGVIIVEYIGRA